MFLNPQKIDAWTPGIGRNPEAYTLKDQVFDIGYRCVFFFVTVVGVFFVCIYIMNKGSVMLLQ